MMLDTIAPSNRVTVVLTDRPWKNLLLCGEYWHGSWLKVCGSKIYIENGQCSSIVADFSQMPLEIRLNTAGYNVTINNRNSYMAAFEEVMRCYDYRRSLQLHFDLYYDNFEVSVLINPNEDSHFGNNTIIIKTGPKDIYCICLDVCSEKTLIYCLRNGILDLHLLAGFNCGRIHLHRKSELNNC